MYKLLDGPQEKIECFETFAVTGRRIGAAATLEAGAQLHHQGVGMREKSGFKIAGCTPLFYRLEK
ncbi:MAG: hypothetical protein CVU38_04240 [Chloroflexi bacterium HGW-Chloroflexi-1]|nr:MAG: hypothetical protein CVU38_04240 [Chloroflexi bacterium HGW-Chloroflexi-1]